MDNDVQMTSNLRRKLGIKIERFIQWEYDHFFVLASEIVTVKLCQFITS